MTWLYVACMVPNRAYMSWQEQRPHSRHNSMRIEKALLGVAQPMERSGGRSRGRRWRASCTGHLVEQRGSPQQT